MGKKSEIGDSLKDFLVHLKRNKATQENINFQIGMKLVVSFYEKIKYEELSEASDEDMLLFQWGTYDWGKGKNFEVGIVRQLIKAETDYSDEEMWQLNLKLKIKPDKQTEKYGKGEFWCHNREEAPAFIEKVTALPFISEINKLPDQHIELYLERV